MPKSDCEPKVLLVDLGNVLVGFDTMRACNDLATYTKLPSAKIHSFLYKESDLKQQFELGQITPTQFHDAVHQKIRATCTYAQFMKAWNSIWTGERTLVVNLLQRVKEKGYKLILVSDTNKSHSESLLPYTFWKLFDPKNRMLSFQLGISKAQNAKSMLDSAVQQAGCSKEECAFIDDKQEYIDTAANIGIEAILYQNTNDEAADARKLEQDLHAAGFYF